MYTVYMLLIRNSHHMLVTTYAIHTCKEIKLLHLFCIFMLEHCHTEEEISCDRLKCMQVHFRQDFDAQLFVL